VPSSDTGVYTCPSDTTTIVKWLQVCNISGTDRDIRVSINHGSGAIEILRRTVLAAKSDPVALWWVLEPGDVVSWRATTASALNAGLFGTELEGVAP
jgi:hypothetical protein